MPEKEPLLRLDNVTSGYGSIRALREASLDVREREIVAVLGSNGAGKSTMLMTIAGLVRAWSGAISFDGQEIQRLRPEEIVRRGISMAPEGRRVFSHLSVVENLRIGAATRSDDDEIAETMEHQFELFPVLKKRHKQLAGTLSGGEQQMLALARCLMSKPKMLLLDEPSLGLAPRVVEQIYDMLSQLPESGVTVLLVEQNVRLALTVSSRGYVLRTGSIAFGGSAHELSDTVDLEKLYMGAGS